MRFKYLIIAPLIILSGCVQFKNHNMASSPESSSDTVIIWLTPGFLTSSPFENAQILYNEGMFLEAKEKLSKVKNDDRDYKAAQELLAKIEMLNEKLAAKHMELGDEYEKANIPEMAAKEYKIALALDPNNQLVQRRLNGVKENNALVQKEAEDGQEYKTAPGFDPNNPLVQRRLNGAKENNVPVQKDMEDRVRPDVLAENHYRKGLAFLELKRFNKAIDEFNMATKLVSSYRDTDKLLAVARKEMSEAISAHLTKGIYYFQKEEMELAIREWDIVLELDPFNEIAGDYRMRAEAILKKMKNMKEEKRCKSC